MGSYKKKKLSNSVDGKGILVAATSTPGTLIHTAVDSTQISVFDETQLYAYNGHTENVVLVVEFGDATSPDHNCITTIIYKAGYVPIVPGFILQNGATIKAFASFSNVITLTGFVNSIQD